MGSGATRLKVGLNVTPLNRFGRVRSGTTHMRGTLVTRTTLARDCGRGPPGTLGARGTAGTPWDARGQGVPNPA
ncbi:unnamed protein product [Musa textilis]